MWEYIFVSRRWHPTIKIVWDQPGENAMRFLDGESYMYVVAHGEGVECYDGHYVEVLTQEEFDKSYAMVSGAYKY